MSPRHVFGENFAHDQPLRFYAAPNPKFGAPKIVVAWAKLTNRDTGEWQMYKTPGLLASDKFLFPWRAPSTTLNVPPAYTSVDSECSKLAQKPLLLCRAYQAGHQLEAQRTMPAAALL